MSVVVGYHPERGGLDAVALGSTLARRLGCPLVVATVVPMPWTTPSMARVDAEFDSWAQQLGEKSARSAAVYLDAFADPIPYTCRVVRHKSVSGGLLSAAADAAANTLVLGSADGPVGEVSLGSTGDRLLHSSSVATAISPRGYADTATDPVRVTCAYAGTAESRDGVREAAALAARLALPLRVVTFAVRGRTMYPPVSGIHAEDAVLAQWSEQSTAALRALVDDGLLGRDTQLQVATGATWRDALSDMDFDPGEILVIGTSPRGAISRVFLGSRATKIVRHSPVSVLVLTG